ncbi:GNAT family N-acetyltransferase [Enterobacter asburiae]|uniref:GNAT family N-acetyltransferase n=1 Tax=Scandinavium sp. UTDF21-P1B TaxID=3446379 RepID=UPI00346DC814
MKSDSHEVAIIPAQQIKGRTIRLRNVAPSDAEFIVNIRTNDKKGRFISATSGDVSKQRKWLEDYLISQGQAYFLITDFDDTQLGTVRMYDQQGDSFCWGSWVVAEAAPSHCAIESALLLYTFALDLGFERAHFDVRKGNLSVIKFHERFGAERTGETEEDFLYSISKEKILSTLAKYRKYLPEKVEIIY